MSRYQKTSVLILCILFTLLSCQEQNKKKGVSQDELVEESVVLYEENWESLKNYEIPNWMEDAKFGIFIHWGPSTVPENYSDWYGQRMYKENHPAFKHHKEKYGDQSKFGYKDLVPMFKAEKFNPKAWVSLFKKAGAKNKLIRE